MVGLLGSGSVGLVLMIKVASATCGIDDKG